MWEVKLSAKWGEEQSIEIFHHNPCTISNMVQSFRQLCLAMGYTEATVNDYLGEEG